MRTICNDITVTNPYFILYVWSKFIITQSKVLVVNLYFTAGKFKEFFDYYKFRMIAPTHFQSDIVVQASKNQAACSYLDLITNAYTLHTV